MGASPPRAGPPADQRIAVLAPRGRDAAVVETLLRGNGVGVQVGATLPGLIGAISGEAEAVDAAIVTEEALAGQSVDGLFAWLETQPPWSDFPFIVLASRHEGARPAWQGAMLERLRNAVLLERPLSGETLASAALAALRARDRQHQLHEHFEAREAAAAALRQLNGTLESRIDERTAAVRAASAALRASEAQFRAYFDNFPECLFVVDVTPDDQFLYHAYNPAAERSFGLCTADVRGQPPEAFLAAPLAAQARSALAHCLATGTVHRFAHEVGLAAGPATFDTVLTPLRDPAGRIARILGASRDVTERNRLEDRLRQAQKLEAIGQLTGGIAHDFNNLLQVISGGLALLDSRGAEAARRAQLIEVLRRATQRGAELTRRLLTVARRQALRPESIDLGAWIEDGVRDLLARTLRGDVVVATDIAPGLPPVLADPAELELTLLNLAVNARDAMPEGGRLTIAARAETQDGISREGLRGDFLIVSVIDTGLGMTADIQARVFEPFFTTKGVGEGTGLGLAQVYGFAQQSGGTVRLVSAPGEGTVVSLVLPCSPDPARREGAPARPRQAGRDQAAGAILVVEDDEDVAALVVDMLAQLGYAPTRVASAGAALGALADGRRIDLMFTDVIMPGGMNGVALAAEAQHRRPGLPVLFTTGYSGSARLPAAADQVLRKPYSMEDLAAAVSAALGRSRIGA